MSMKVTKKGLEFSRTQMEELTDFEVTGDTRPGNDGRARPDVREPERRQPPRSDRWGGPAIENDEDEDEEDPRDEADEDDEDEEGEEEGVEEDTEEGEEEEKPKKGKEKPQEKTPKQTAAEREAEINREVFARLFYRQHPELKEHGEAVAALAIGIEKRFPNLPDDELMDRIAKAAYASLDVKQPKAPASLPREQMRGGGGKAPKKKGPKDMLDELTDYELSW